MILISIIKYVKAYPLVAERPGLSTDKPDHYLPYWKELSAAGVRGKYYMVLVEVGTDDGFVGWGEALVREVPTAHEEIIEKLLSRVIVGHDPLAIEELWQRMFASLKTRGHFGGYFVEALSGVDIALWDLVGKLLKLPVHKLLRGPTSDRIKAYASSIYWHYMDKLSPDAVAKEVMKLRNDGFEQVKIKIGMEKIASGGPTVKDVLKAVRDVAGYDVGIMVDANSAYNVNEAIRVGRVLERYEVIWFEEPLPPNNVEGYSELRRKLDVMIAGGESLFTKFQFMEYVRRKALDVLQPDIARVGGITEFMKVVAIAEAEGLLIAPHVGLSGPGCRAASIQVSASVPREVFLSYEYMYKGDNALAKELPTHPVETTSKGYIEVCKQPGLCFEPSKDAISKFLLKS
ncbi:MAG: mandelate racemase/muconate lactonizing enzyme family protein [Sulfolobales archaeon]|nr:mandelate racemase/muconate lactonizing enzyme family protein [Sulfolobales archaeon]